MDPITAVGFAASILTFIDFSWSVITGSYEVYKSTSGTTAENAHISTVVGDLERVTDGLISDVEGKTKHERELCKLADQCHDLSQDLSKILQKLQVAEKNSKWKSLKIKVASMRKEKEIASIENRLDRYRSQILVRLNFMLSEQQSSVKVQLDKIEKEGAKMSAETAARFTCLRKELNAAVTALLETKDRAKPHQTEEEFHPSTDICSAVSKLQVISTSLSRENQILRRLYFDNMYVREDTIANAESGTFKWIIGEIEDETWGWDAEKTRAHTRDSFLTWLRSGNQTYHISGKAGSGKSTLMKFLCQNPRVQEELKSWAAEKKLVFAQFFFWNSGEKLQMSLEGLYRSLLFETLKQYPELIPEIFPEEWDVLDAPISTFESPSFRIAEIKAAFNRLVNKRTFPNHRLCFFIDGLDEYEGDSTDHWELAKNFQEWARSTDIKICVSSRPHTEFMETFSDDSNLRLRLHELTQYDIKQFASAMFEKDINFDRVKDSYMNLVENIVEMANGVFLWARLVVRSLLEGVGHYDSQSALQEKLSSIPKDLDQLFSKLLGSINPSDRKRSDQMLLIATGDAPSDPINALAYSWLEDLEDPKFPFSSPVQGYSDEEIQKRHRNLRPQLDSLSKGLLEMIPNERGSEDIFFGYTIQFFHRTVRDYLRDGLRQSEFQNRLPSFNRDEVYARLHLAELKFARTKESYFSDSDNLLYDMFKNGAKWHRNLSNKGRKVPFNFGKELSVVINSYRHQPFSYPGETKSNLGLIEWGKNFSIDGRYFKVKRRVDLSYLSWAALHGQLEYIALEVSKNPTLAKGGSEINLLLSASLYGSNAELVRFLLQAGADPQDQVKSYGSGTTNAKTATVWMIFLFRLASIILAGDIDDQPLFEDLSLVLEEYLKFDVDTDIFFLITLESGKEKFSVSLEKLIRFHQPKNLGNLQTLLQAKAKRPFWSDTISGISHFMPWNKAPTFIKSDYKTLELDKVEGIKLDLEAVCSKTLRLNKGFQFRFY